MIECDDGLPQYICNSCLDKLFQVYSFIKQCQISDKTLRSMLRVDENNEKVIIMELVESDTNVKCVRETSNREVFEYESSYNNAADENELLEDLKVVNSSLSLNSNSTDEKKKPRRKYACVHCSKLFTYTNLKQHMRIHTKEKPFACEVCQMQFSINGNLRRHMMIHTGERPHICDFCGKGFIQTTSLVEHRRSHTGEMPFMCNYCGMQFARSGKYHAHVRKHLIKDKREGARIKANKIKFKKLTHNCYVCHQLFSTKSILKTHMLTHGEKNFLCSYCGIGFVSNAGLDSHLKVHTGLKPFSCTECNKSFSQLGSLKSHKFIHTGERPFVCVVCSKNYTQRNHLVYHMRTHNGEKPYVCSYCNKPFALKGTLTVHIRTHTGETPYVCDVCNKGFYDSSSMKKHRRGHEQTLLKVTTNK